MAKRRTKKQKEEAKHHFTISWRPDISPLKSKAKKGRDEASVKGQFNYIEKTQEPKNGKIDNASNTDKIYNLASIKKDILKSLILAGVILASEVVLYLTWKS